MASPSKTQFSLREILSAFSKSKISSIVAGFVITTVLFAVGFLLFKPFYMTNDDVLITLLAMGFGTPNHNPSEFLLWVNILFGFLLKWLYNTWPEHHWYGFILFSIFFLSTWTMSFVFFKTPDRIRLFLIFVVLPTTFFYFFTQMEWTVVAFGASQAALFLAFEPPPETGWKPLVLAGLLFFSSSLIRFSSAVLGLAAFLPIALYQWKQSGPSLRLRQILFLLFTLGFSILAFLFHRSFCESRPGWKGFYSKAAIVTDIIEFRGLSPGPASDKILDSVGWDSLDFSLFANYYFSFDSKFDPANLSKLENEMPPPYAHKGFKWMSVFGSEFVQIQWLALLFLCFFLPTKNYRWIFLNSLWVFLVFLCLFYFMKINPWVTWPLFAYLPFSTIFFTQVHGKTENLNEKNLYVERPRLWAWAAFVLWAMLASTLFFGTWHRNQMDIQKEKQLQQDMAAFGFPKDHLCVIWAGGFPFKNISVFGNYDLLKSSPIYWLSWWALTPDSKELPKEFGLENPFRDMVNRKDVYFMLPKNYSTMYNLYLQRDFNIEPTFLWVFHGEQFDVYNVLGKPSPKT